MFRHAECTFRIILCAAVFTVMSAFTARAADEVTGYLERLGLDEMRAAHLERRLHDSRGEMRERLAEQLAQVYGALLDRASDPRHRTELEERLSRILDGPLAGASPELRLPLLRSRYRMIENVAERLRMALDEEDEVERAIALLDPVIRELISLETLVTQRAERLRDRLNRASSIDASTIQYDMERALDRQAQITFLIAWAHYYRMILEDNPAHGSAAEQRFGRLLSLDAGELRPDNVSLELRGEEAISRCILGLALVYARVRSPASAMPWLDLLEHEDAWGPLKESVDAWRFVILVEGGDSDEALRLLRDMSEHVPIDVAVLRMGALAGLRSESADHAAVSLRTWCIQRLAEEGEFGQLHDLALRFGLERMGAGSSFAMGYVTGIVRLHEARSLAESDAERSRQALIAASEAFAVAIASSESERFSDAVTECIRLAGVVQAELGHHLRAGDYFATAASRLIGERAADSLAAAIGAFEHLLNEDPGDGEVLERLNSLVNRFSERFPHDPRAIMLMMRKALRSPVPRMEDVEELLRVPSDASVSVEATRVALDLLFRIYRAESDPAERAMLAGRFMDLALPVQKAMTRRMDVDDDGEMLVYSVTGRRILEVALLAGAEQVQIAQSVLDDFESVMVRRPDFFHPIEAEIHYRRLRERLASGDADAAVAAATRVRAADPDGHWAKVTDQALFVHADRAWRQLPATDTDDRRILEVMIEFGGRHGERLKEDDPEYGRVETIAVLARVAEAETIRFLRSGDSASGERARARLDALLQIRPRDTGLLRTRARLADAMDEHEIALDCWRILAAGLSRGTPVWFEARLGQIRILAERDPSVARQLLSELRVLYPEFGPEPYASELRALDLSVPGREAGKR